MYDLHKVIIIGGFSPGDKEELQTIAMETQGMRVCSVLYLDDAGSIKSDEEAVYQEIKDNLYDDMYDEDTLKIKAKEVYDGKEAIKRLAKYIDKCWDESEDLQVYYYEPDGTTFQKLQEALMERNGRIYLADYNEIFIDRNVETGKSIKEIMKSEGLKMENLIEGNNFLFIYYLAALVEKLLSR